MAEETPPGEADGDDEGEAPLSELADRLRRRREERGAREVPRGRGSGVGPDPFVEAPSFDEPDVDSLWEAIEASAEREEAGAAEGEAGAEYVVPKRAYCEGCEYLSEPPDVHCTHPGTTILEFVDTDHVRVRDCPVVAERRRFGDQRRGGVTPTSSGGR